jgi:hypothetical protein
MRKLVLWIAILGTTLLPVLYSAPAQAQATRTWVSGVGDDANPCSRTAPCKTFAGAISKTAPGGEINCLDPGGFGALTITKSITIDCHEVFASVLVSGTNGITINAAGGSVTLRNLNFNGIGAGLSGINILAAAKVYIEDVMIMNFTQNGINDARTSGNTKLFVRNTITRNNTSVGIRAVATNPNSVVLENVHSVGNAFGIAAGNGNFVTVSRSIASGNSNAGIEADAGGIQFVNNTEISSNGTGVQAAGIIQLANSDILFNSTAITGATTSFGNNRIFGNAAAGTTPSLGAVSNDHGQQ